MPVTVAVTLAYIECGRVQVCGLKWSFDDQQLASGGNDNKLFIWDASSMSPLTRFNEHTAAVKAIAWSPHQVLWGGGGVGWHVACVYRAVVTASAWHAARSRLAQNADSSVLCWRGCECADGLPVACSVDWARSMACLPLAAAQQTGGSDFGTPSQAQRSIASTRTRKSAT